MSPAAKTRVWGLAIMVFFTLGTYALARPAVESLFLETHGAARLPFAWLGVALGVVATVTLYNRWAARADLVRVYGASSALSALVLIALLLMRSVDLSAAVFALYLWKDIYIVVLIETFWAQANSAVPADRAKRIYGLFCVLGSIGGMSGNLLAGFVAQTLGTEWVLYIAAVVLLAVGLGCRMLLAKIGTQDTERPDPPSFKAGFTVLRHSRTLWLLMALVAISQVVITLIDYQMNIALERVYPDTDGRTAIIGRIYAAIDFVAMGLQLATGPILRALGVSAVLLLIPSLLGGAVAGFALLPRFALIAGAKVASKAFDYSLFRAAKEILYIPLNHAERTQGKALVDICSYRVAKGACSLLLLGLAALGSGTANLNVWIPALCLGFIGLWIAVTVALRRLSR